MKKVPQNIRQISKASAPKKRKKKITSTDKTKLIQKQKKNSKGSVLLN